LATTSDPVTRHTFFVELIKPSNYDDDGYVIQWRRSFSISNSIACLYGLTDEIRQTRQLGDDVDIVVNVHDDHNTIIPTEEIIHRIKGNGSSGVICLVGVQTNEFPRSVDIALPFREADIPVVIGGFHVSGCLAMLSELPADLQEALDLGITLYAGEAEGRLGELFSDAYHRRLKTIYRYLDDLPDLDGHPTPFLPEAAIKRTLSSDITLDTSRGCPYDCSFCTVINVQGQKSRYRSTKDVEQAIRSYGHRGRKKKDHFFFTDDNFARNRNWESIFDLLIELREKESYKVKFTMQIDAKAYKLPRFIDKATRAGCNMVFIGMESINSQNIAAANKPQNSIPEYLEMLEAWRSRGVVTMAGYILGFPFDTVESIEQDIKTIQKELPLDILMFFTLIPLPGSVDHKRMLDRGDWMDPDLNKYDSIHVTQNHPNMTEQEWKAIFRKAWKIYYSPEHVETLLRRGLADGISSSRLFGRIFISRCAMDYENVHPFAYGAIRRKVRTQRRRGMPLENPIPFYLRRIGETLRSSWPVFRYFIWLKRLVRRLKLEMKTNSAV